MTKTLLFLILPLCGFAQDFWTEVAPFPSDPNYYSREISIVNDDVVWVDGYDYLNFANPHRWSRSEDAGITWTSGIIDLGNPDLSVGSIFALSAAVAYVTVFPNAPGSQGGLWATHDGGITWAQITSPSFSSSESFADFVHFWDASHGITVGDPESGYFEIYITSDGINWARVPEANLPAPLTDEYGYTGMLETRGDNIWFGTNHGRLFHSSDQGLHWTVSQTPAIDFGGVIGGATFAFRNANEGLLVTTEWEVYRTLDGGAIWTHEFPDPLYPRNFHTVFVPQTNNAYFSWGQEAAAVLRGSTYTTNGGQYWIDLNETDMNPVIPDQAEFQSGTVGFCIGDYVYDGDGIPKFFRLTDPLNRLLKSESFVSAEKFSAAPNPATDLIAFSGKDVTEVVLSDVTGKIVMRKNFDRGDVAQLDISTLRGGLYVANISDTNGSHSAVKIVKQ